MYHIPHHPETAGLTESWTGLRKEPLKCQLRGNTLKRQRPCLGGQRHIYGTVSLKGIRESGNQEVEAEVTLLTPFSVTHWADFVSLVSETLCSAGSEVLVLKEGTPLPGHTARVPLNYKLRLPPRYFEVLVQQRSADGKRSPHMDKNH